MKWSTIIIAIIGLFACNNISDKTIAYEQSNTFHVDNIRIDSNEINVSVERPLQEFHKCNFDKYIADKKTPKLAKDIFLGNEWNLGKDDEALALLDSLNAKDKLSRPFYFKIVSLTIKKSDGYFSEGLGLKGKQYIENNTIEFVDNFNHKECFTGDDLNNWADIVMLELGLFGQELATNKVVEEYINTLQSNCRSCNTEQNVTIMEFGKLLLNKKNKLILDILHNKKPNR